MKNITIFIIILFFINCSHKTTPFELTPGYHEKVPKVKLLIDDFQDKNFSDEIGGSWSAENDTVMGGNSIISHLIATNIYNNMTNYYLKITYTLGPAYQYRYVFEQDNFNNDNDFSYYDGIKVKIKGSGHKLRIIIRSDTVSDGNYDDYGYDILNTPSEWREYIIPFTDFKQEGWGGVVDKSAVLRKVNKLQFKASSQVSRESGWFAIDDLGLYKIE